MHHMGPATSPLNQTLLDFAQILWAKIRSHFHVVTVWETRKRHILYFPASVGGGSLLKQVLSRSRWMATRFIVTLLIFRASLHPHVNIDVDTPMNRIYHTCSLLCVWPVGSHLMAIRDFLLHPPSSSSPSGCHGNPCQWAIGFNLSYRSIIPWSPPSLGLTYPSVPQYPKLLTSPRL
jgi:hypothetical protein